jgi:hypothetical protein
MKQPPQTQQLPALVNRVKLGSNQDMAGLTAVPMRKRLPPMASYWRQICDGNRDYISH